MKRGWKILLGLTAALGLLIALLVFTHYRAKRAVEAYRRYLREHGEKPDLASLIPPPVPPQSNGAADFITAASRLSSRSPAGNLDSMRVLGPGHVLVVWAEEISPAQNSTNIWPGLSALARANQPQLTAIRAALARPVLQFELNYSLSLNAPLPYNSFIQSAAARLFEAVVTDLQEGRSDSAWGNLKTLVALPRVYPGEPLLGSQVSRAYAAGWALAATWQTLQYPGITESQWAGLQRDWESFNLLDGLETSLAMQRAFNPEIYEQARESYTNFVYIGGGNPNSTFMNDVGSALINPARGLGATVGRRPRYLLWKWWWSYDEELCDLQIQQAGLEAARSLMTHLALIPVLDGFDRHVAAINAAHASNGNHLLLGFKDETSAMIHSHLQRMAYAEAQRRMVVTAIALKRYQLRHGAYPADLRELTPDWLRDPPVDLMDGKPLRYRPKPDGGFLLYSVGVDGRDDGGDATSGDPSGVRNKNWWRARDAVWPAPATPEEVRSYEADMLANIAAWRSRFPSSSNPNGLSKPPPADTTRTN